MRDSSIKISGYSILLRFVKIYKKTKTVSNNLIVLWRLQ